MKNSGNPVSAYPAAIQAQITAQLHAKPYCARNWGSEAKGWTFCTLDRGHPGNCYNRATGAKPADQLFFEEQPEAAASLEKQRVRKAKEDSR